MIDGKPPVNEEGAELVCSLKRGLRGLRQGGYLWSTFIRGFMCSTNCKSDDLTEEEVEGVGDGRTDFDTMRYNEN